MNKEKKKNEYTTISVPRWLKKALDDRKVHRRQAYHEVIALEMDIDKEDYEK